MNPWIHYIKDGIGYRHNNDIYLNEDLKKYPKLHNFVLQHERKHLSGRNTWEDVKIDVLDAFNWRTLQLLLFIIVRPKTWKALLPFFKERGIWVMDVNLTILYCILTTIAVITAFT